MKISTILDHVDSGDIALPKFQRGYVWNRDQVRGLMDSLYRQHPVGSLLVWVTSADGVDSRGDQALAPGVVRLLLDGQQRITSLYGSIRGTAPTFFDGNSQPFTGIYFHIETEDFRFYQQSLMRDNPHWINITQLMQKGHSGLGEHITWISSQPQLASDSGKYIGRLNKLLGIRDIELHIEEVTGADKTVEVVVDIFNRVNSGGTKLSQGDLTLAKICGFWPEGREQMQAVLSRWQENGYEFSLDWLLRNMNAIITGEARFTYLQKTPTSTIQDGLTRAEKSIDYALNLIAGRLGLDHDRVLFGRYAIPVMSRYIDQRNMHLEDVIERDRLLCWYFQSAMWGRFSASTESTLDADFEAIADINQGTDLLFEQLRLWHGSLRVKPAHFRGWSRGARFYPVLYALTRIGEAKDWDNGLSLKNGLLGKMNALEVHHIFPKSLLYKQGLQKSQVNAVANFCFLTKNTNLKIGARAPSEYFVDVEQKHPGSLASQWIPMNTELWKTENYAQFLEERQRLLADATNALIEELLHDVSPAQILDTDRKSLPETYPIPRGIEDIAEEETFKEINQWLRRLELPEGQIEYEISHPDTGQPLAILDLAWPNGLQEGLSEPVALLLDEQPATLQIAADYGFRHFTNADAFKHYVESDVAT
ncbi:MAG: DUF262 domain-containing protein [bacterium]|nr:DUF262 domain-containing protein [bacterium]